MQLINSCRLYGFSIFAWLFQTTNDYMYAMYNDQPPEGHTSLNHGHTKGKEIAQNHWRTNVHHINCAFTLTTDVKYIKWAVITTAGDCHHKKDIHSSTCYLKCQNKYWRTTHILSTITMYNWRRRAQNLKHHHNHRRTSQKPYCLHSNWRTAQILYCHQVKLMTYSTTILTFT